MAEPVHYVKTDRGHIGYQTVGDGTRDLLFMADAFGNLDTQWEEPAYARTLRRLSEVGRLIMVNRRGIGVSDPLVNGEGPTLQAWCDDVVSVLDELGTDSVAVIATGGAGPAAISLAAQQPERVSALALLGSWAALRKTDDYPIGMNDDVLDIAAQATEDMWGSGMMMQFGAPDRANEQRLSDWYARMERAGASPTTARAVQEMAVNTDVRELLGQVRCPTAVIHRQDDPIIDIELGRYIADHVPGATFLALPGSAHLCFGDAPLEWLAEVRHLLTGSRVGGPTERALRTMMFSDIVASTAYAARVGDERWHDLLNRYEELVELEISAWDGVLIHPQGDGHLATFERPVSAIRCAKRIGKIGEQLGIGVRCGLHTGEVELRGNDLAGVAVHLASRVCDQADASEIYVSRTIVDLVVGSEIEFESKGDFELKGVPGSWELFAVTDC